MNTFVNRRLILACSFLLPLASVLAAESKSSDEQTIRDLDAQWSKAASARDVDKTVSYYSDDAVVMPANLPIATTKEAVRKFWQDLLTSPGAAISWKATKAEVARSGDMAWLIGTYELTMNDATGKPVNDHGKYTVVWEKKAGTWKVAVDIWNSDLSPSGTASTETK